MQIFIDKIEFGKKYIYNFVGIRFMILNICNQDIENIQKRGKWKKIANVSKISYNIYWLLTVGTHVSI